MLPVKYRIKKEFLPTVLKQNKAFSSPKINLRVHFRSASELNFNKQSRLAVIVSKKVAPLAITRHLIKRRIMAVLEKVWLTIPDNLDIIIQIKEDVSKLDFSDLEKEVLVLLKTAKISK
jgi:ribonuclease P protein component